MNMHMTNVDQFANANGKLVLQLGWRGAWTAMQFYGGPYNGCPPAPVFAVSVRAERMEGRRYDVHLPIVDYEVPLESQRGRVIYALKKTFQAALDGKDIWIGCMGGMGRTGLFMAIMAKAAGYADPVGYVRFNYYSHAVETPEQKQYVEDFDVTEIRSWLHGRCWKAYLRKMIGLK